jgi:hypothetical protein
MPARNIVVVCSEPHEKKVNFGEVLRDAGSTSIAGGYTILVGFLEVIGMDLRALLAEKREDRFSMTFASLLKMAPVLDGFLQQAKFPAIGGSAEWKISTQLSVPGGIADLSLEAEGGIVLVEAKLDSPLGNDQPVAYAKFLEARRKQRQDIQILLVMLTPAATGPTIMKLATERLREAGVAVPVVLVTWEETAVIAKTVAAQATVAPDDVAYLRAYADLIDHYVGLISRPLTNGETMVVCGTEARHATWEALQLVAPVADALAERLEGNLTERSSSNGNFYRGMSMKYKERSYWLGYWMDPWLTYGESVLWIQMIDRKPILPSMLRATLHLREWGRSYICPLPLVAGLERDAHAAVLSEICERVVRAEDDSAAPDSAMAPHQ